MATVTRKTLCEAIQKEQGYTYREARVLVKTLFDILIEDLKEHGTLELPIGTLTLVASNPQRAYRFGKLVRMYTKPKVRFRKKE